LEVLLAAREGDEKGDDGRTTIDTHGGAILVMDAMVAIRALGSLATPRQVDVK
jgi:hypothetical protein